MKKNIYPQWIEKNTRGRHSYFILIYIVLLHFIPAFIIAQTVRPSVNEQKQARLQNSMNKSTPETNKTNSGNFSLLSTPFIVTPADEITTPLSNIIQSLVGPGVTVSNIQTSLPATSNIYGSFSGGTTAIGMDKGLIMTSGSVLNALGPNISPYTSQDNGLPGYLVSPDTIGYDAAVISFDVTSSTSFLSFKYVFASEEYNEYVGSVFNDAFAFFITGPGIAPGTNIALLPGTSTPVAINNVNLGLNSKYYINNESSLNADPIRFQLLEYDGLTKVLATTAITVIPGETYTITLVIQDFADAVYDSGVFIEGGSITSNECIMDLFAEKQDITCNGGNDGAIEVYYNGANGNPTFAWTNGATTQEIEDLPPGTYNVIATDEKGCTATLATPVVIEEPPAIILGQPEISNASCGGSNNGSAIVSATGGTPPYQYTIGSITNSTGIFLDLPAGPNYYSVTDSRGCTKSGSFIIPAVSNISCSIIVSPNPSIPGQASNTIYLGYGPQSLSLTASVISGTEPFTYDWGGAGTGSSINVSPVITTTYSLTVTDKNGCQSSCSVAIYVVDIRCGINKVQICHRNYGRKEFKTLCVDPGSIADHLAHNDQLGTCNIQEITGAGNTPVLAKKNMEHSPLNARVSPNPTSGHFSITIESGNAKDKVRLRVLDINGRQVEVMNNLTAGQNTELGNNYKQGNYIAEITQGDQRIILHLVKF
jgi:hypothetical protein